MSVQRVEVLVEEPSMEALLRTLLPRLLGTVSFVVHPFQCKAELLKELPSRLRSFQRMLPDNWRVVVVVDRDNDDCHALKLSLEQMARRAGLSTRSSAGGTSCRVVPRLVIEELEAWYFGDWDAVRAAYPRVPATIPKKQGYRDPDAVKGGTWEAFERVLKKAGYFEQGLQKVRVARSIAEHMDPFRNTSRSFQVFRDAILEMTGP